MSTDATYQPGDATGSPAFPGSPGHVPTWTTSAFPLPGPVDGNGFGRPGPPTNPWVFGPAMGRPYSAALPTNLGMAIFGALLFFPLGAYAMYLAGQVNMHRDMGDALGAVEKSTKARVLAMISIVLGLLTWTVVLIVWLNTDHYDYSF